MEFNGFEIRTFIGWLFRSVNLFKYLHANFSLETHIISIENSEEITIIIIIIIIIINIIIIYGLNAV